MPPDRKPTHDEIRRILRIAQDGAARFPSQAVQFRAIIAEAEALLAHDVVESTHRAAVVGAVEQVISREDVAEGYDREATQALVATEPPDPKAAK